MECGFVDVVDGEGCGAVDARPRRQYNPSSADDVTVANPRDIRSFPRLEEHPLLVDLQFPIKSLLSISTESVLSPPMHTP